MENREQLEIPKLEFTKVTLLGPVASGCERDPDATDNIAKAERECPNKGYNDF